VIRFDRAYNEQLYDATFHVQPLPAHLVASIPDSLFSTSAFTAHPVGNGPYRWGRRVPGQLHRITSWAVQILRASSSELPRLPRRV
jgi:hypothetical protein